jgi:glycolate oxidase
MGSEIPLADGAEAALLFKLDGTPEGVAAEVRRLNAALNPVRPVSVVTGSGAEEDAVWAVRRDISPASYRLKPSKISEDISVPRGKVARLVEIAQAAGRDFGLPVLCYGHLGDGNIHTNIMHDAAVAAEVETAHKVKELLFRAAVELGGTISGEHGTGLTKASFVAEQLSAEELRIMTDIRRAFDPHEIMNPGKGW